MSVDGKRFCFFVEAGALGVLASQANWHLHQNALAAALGTGMNGGVGRLGHTFSFTSILPGGESLRSEFPQRGCQRVYSDLNEPKTLRPKGLSYSLADAEGVARYPRFSIGT